MLNAIITLSPDDSTLGALRGFLAEADRFVLADDLALLDGGHVGLPGRPSVTVGRHGHDIAAVRRFVSELTELPDETVLEFGTDLGVDLPVFGIAPIGCGDHVGSLPENVIVTVNASCGGHDA
jgi:hypothetical protein